MAQAIFYTLCIPFIDIYITDPDIIHQLKIRKNEMTMYTHLSQEQQKILHQFAKSSKDVKAYYGGMSYNTCAEIAKKQKNITAVFIGPFSADSITQKVFGEAIKGKVHGLIVLPEHIDSGSGQCFVIPNGSNRAMITKINPDQKITKTMVDEFVSRIRKEETEHANALYIAGYTVETSPDAMSYLIEQKRAEQFNCLTILNLADPGVIERAYDSMRPFIEESDWIIGNKEEYTKLFLKGRKREPITAEELYSYIDSISQNAVITAGSEEAVVIYTKGLNKQRISIQPKEIEVNNTTGAGDIFAANFFSSLLLSPEGVYEALDRAVSSTNAYLTKISVRSSPHQN